MEKVKTWNHNVQLMSFSSSVFFSEAAPQNYSRKYSWSKILENSIGKLDLCFSCRAWTFISTEIELCSMLSLEFWGSHFSKYLLLIAVTKKLFIKISQYSQENTWRLQHRCFPVTIPKFLRAPILKTSSNDCFCVTILFYLPSLPKFIQNYYFMFSFCYYVVTSITLFKVGTSKPERDGVILSTKHGYFQFNVVYSLVIHGCC